MVTLLTASMMGVEIVAGIVFGSMALLADGLHMASHATALSINALAYIYARRHAHDPRFTFGTGKVNTLGGFTGAMLLGIFALWMAWESVRRMIAPVPIELDQAIFIAVLGLLVNGVSVWMLDVRHDHSHGKDGPHSHSHSHDHNLRAAYLHVLADTLTSALAIGALLAAKYGGWVWMDPFMGIVGAALVTRWAAGLLRDTGRILLDQSGPEAIRKKIQAEIESDGDSRITDLHLWALGPELYGVIVSVVARHPREPEEYKKRIASDSRLVHITVEVCQCKEDK